MDHNDSGRISRKEFEAGITTLGVRDLTETDMRNMMQRFDRNGDGKIDYREFLTLIRDDDNNAHYYTTHNRTHNRYNSSRELFDITGGTRQFEQRLRMKLRQSNAVHSSTGGATYVYVSLLYMLVVLVVSLPVPTTL
jgi:hypothetical protein